MQETQSSELRPERVAPGLVRAGAYERSVGASLERVLENVLDWEHLPGLHRDSFDSVECLESGPDGWVARVGARGEESIIEVCIRRDRLDYVSRTCEGRGAGTEIWTDLDPVDANRTEIHVELWVPDRGRPLERVGASFVSLYARLWAEDEAMMQRRTAMLRQRRPRTEARPLELGPVAAVRATLPRLVTFAGREYRVVEVEGELVAHATLCPHLLGPLEDARVESGHIECPWHRYRFDVRTGRCVGRPYRLAPPPRVEIKGDRVWLSSPARPRSGQGLTASRPR